MVSKIDLKPLKLKEESSLTCTKFTKRKINFLSELTTHVYCGNYNSKQSILDYNATFLKTGKNEKCFIVIKSCAFNLE